MARRARKQRQWIEVGPIEVLEPSSAAGTSGAEALWMWSLVGAVGLLGVLAAMVA